MSKYFLSLENAVKIAHREWGADREIAKNEFFQKCYLSDEQYDIGVYDGLSKAIEGLEAARQSLVDNGIKAAVVPISELKRLRKEMDEIIYETSEGETILWTCESMIDSLLEAYEKK